MPPIEVPDVGVLGMSDFDKEIIWRSPPEKSSWQLRAEWYEKDNNRLRKSLFKIRKMIDDLELESGWGDALSSTKAMDGKANKQSDGVIKP